MKKTTSLKWQVLILSTFVFLLAQGFSTLLGILSYQQGLTNSVVSSNLVIASDFQHQLERALRFGKDIQNFYGIDKLMESVQQDNEHFTRVDVFRPDGQLLYSTSNAVLSLPKKLCRFTDESSLQAFALPSILFSPGYPPRFILTVADSPQAVLV